MIHIDGCQIEHAEDSSIMMSMVRYLERLKPIKMPRSRKKEQDQIATAIELMQYQSFAYTIVYLGKGFLPQAAYITSTLQQLLPRIKVEHLTAANNMLKEVLALMPKITYLTLPDTKDISEVMITSFSDASFNHSTATGYGQTALITGLRIIRKNGADLFHAIDWSCSEQRHESCSPYGAEVLACTDADDRGFYLKKGLNEMFEHTKVRSELCTDSRCLYDTITMLHEARDYRLPATVQRLPNSFDSQELDVMKWIPGDANTSDALTKRNPNTTQTLNQLLVSGVICIDVDSGYAVKNQQ